MSLMILFVVFLVGLLTAFLILFVSSFNIKNNRLSGILNLIDRGKLDGQYCSFCESGLRLGIENRTMRTAKWCPKCLKIVEIFDAPILTGKRGEGHIGPEEDDDDFLKQNRLKF